MAEFVQQNIEDMLPELEFMERVQLFTGKEVKYVSVFCLKYCIIAQSCLPATAVLVLIACPKYSRLPAQSRPLLN